MKRLLSKIFSRLTIVAVSIILQIIFSVAAPYLIVYLAPDIFSNVYISIDLVISIIGLCLLIYIVNSEMIVEGKMIWIIVILIFPIFGLIIYTFFVADRFPKKYKKLYKKVTQASYAFLTKTEQENAQLKLALSEKYGQFEYIYNASNLKAYQNSKVEYISTGEQFFDELKTELVKAKKFIFMEYFIIEKGEVWNKIHNILRQKVKEGVEVRLMYDDLGTINKLPNNFAKKLNKEGISCVKVNSFVPIMSSVHNNRDHRKITVIDGKTAFVGGINIADEYANLKQKFGYWKDTAVKITGQANKNLIIMFLQLFGIQKRQVQDYEKYVNCVQEVETDGIICPYGDGPKYAYKEYVAENVYLNIINQAQNYVYITTPYLIIDNKLTNALCNAARRGVDVKIITPHIPDKKTIFRVTRSSYKQLQEAGVKIYEFEKGFMHAKQLVCDDELAVVGTINLDYRSLLHHYECGVLMYKSSCIKKIKQDFEHLLTISLDMKNYKQNPITRLFCALIKGFTPLL